MLTYSLQGGWVGGWGFTLIIILISVQLALSLSTGTELGNNKILIEQFLDANFSFYQFSLPKFGSIMNNLVGGFEFYIFKIEISWYV